jgi:hypothetical protein
MPCRSTFRSRCSPSSEVSQLSGSTVGGSRGKEANVGKAVRGGRLPHESRLQGPLPIVVRNFGFGDGASLLQVGRSIRCEALLLRGPVGAFDKRVLLGMMGSADLNLNAQASPKAHQGGRKITALGTAYPAHITVQRDALRPTRPCECDRQGEASPFPP